MNTVPIGEGGVLRLVLDQTAPEVHVYDGDELALTLDLAEAAELGIRLMSLHRSTRRYVELPCPPWCTTDHAKHAGVEDDLRGHTRTIGDVPTTCDGDHSVAVDVQATDNLADGTREAPQIILWGSGYGDGLTADQACQLAGVLLQAADFLTGIEATS